MKRREREGTIVMRGEGEGERKAAERGRKIWGRRWSRRRRRGGISEGKRHE